MGTLFNQPARYNCDRNHNLESNINYYKEMAAKTGVTFNQVVSVATLIESARTNDLYHANGDIHDEQMAGFGELIVGINEGIRKLAFAIEDSNSD